MIKVFTTNKEGKIELTKDELKRLLDESYWDGFRANQSVYEYRSPFWTPYTWNAKTASNMCELKLNNDSTTSASANSVYTASGPNSACETH